MKVDICIRNELTGCRTLTELLTAKLQSYGVADGTHLVVRSGRRMFKSQATIMEWVDSQRGESIIMRGSMGNYGVPC